MYYRRWHKQVNQTARYRSINKGALVTNPVPFASLLLGSRPFLVISLSFAIAVVTGSRRSCKGRSRRRLVMLRVLLLVHGQKRGIVSDSSGR